MTGSVDPCWICWGDVHTPENPLTHLGCACRRSVHLHCASDWYALRITQIAMRDTLANDWDVRSYLYCETCKKLLHKDITSTLAKVALSNSHPPPPPPKKMRRAWRAFDWIELGMLVLSALLVYMHYHLLRTYFKMTPEMCVHAGGLPRLLFRFAQRYLC